MTSQIFSKKLISETNSYGVGLNELVMADLISIGYTKMDAFYLAFPDYQARSALEARNIMDSISRGDRFKALVRERTRQHTNSDVDRLQQSEGLIDKTQAAQEILNVARSLPENSKERGEMFVKYMEMLRKNDETVDAGNDHISYYLPLTCAKCSLYSKFQAAQRAKEQAERRALEASKPSSAST